jgi:hypothetical protein
MASAENEPPGMELHRFGAAHDPKDTPSPLRIVKKGVLTETTKNRTVSVSFDATLESSVKQEEHQFSQTVNSEADLPFHNAQQFGQANPHSNQATKMGQKKVVSGRRCPQTSLFVTKHRHRRPVLNEDLFCGSRNHRLTNPNQLSEPAWSNAEMEAKQMFPESITLRSRCCSSESAVLRDRSRTTSASHPSIAKLSDVDLSTSKSSYILSPDITVVSDIRAQNGSQTTIWSAIEISGCLSEIVRTSHHAWRGGDVHPDPITRHSPGTISA